MTPATTHADRRIDLTPDQLIWVDGFATPPSPKVRPFHALASAIKLVLNKDDTRQVFEVVTALSGASGRKLFRRFVATDYGRRVVAEPVELENILADFARLRAMPAGSFGRAYVDFMDEAGFTPQGLLAAAEEASVDMKDFPEIAEFRRAFTHLEVSHDLWHVLTGYGRDPLGEVCNLAFTRRQTRNPGLRLIIFMGLAAMKLERWSVPVMKAARQAAHMGEAADFVLGHDVEALLPLPLAEVRTRLNILEPTVYNAVPDGVKHKLLRPKVAQTQTERERAKAAPLAA
ncbi:MAG: hypothetical protein KDA46_06550 [Parvularculaceae bacterium]|nr:hypothetical protein [Parvularculaceae bacterium]